MSTAMDHAINYTKVSKFLAQRFISRTDVFAEQLSDGTYRPVRRKITGKDLIDHLSGAKTYGHYILDQDSKTKLFALDVDLQTEGFIPTVKMPDLGALGEQPAHVITASTDAWQRSFKMRSLREVWKDRKDPARDYLKYCFRYVMGKLNDSFIQNVGSEVRLLNMYSGSKGFHVYGLLALPKAGSQALERVSGGLAREAALLTLEHSGIFEPKSNPEGAPSGATEQTFWTGKEDSPEAGLFSVEIFPKQAEINAQAGELGNLLRLPLGKNLKHPRDKSFFVNGTLAYGELAPMNLDLLV